MTVQTFRPDRSTYIRAHAWMATISMAGAMLVLWLIGSPHIWTGGVAALAAITVRGWYLASEELAVEWTLDNGVLSGPAERRVALGEITQMRSMGGYVQIITQGGDKHLIKYQPDPEVTIAAIERARQ